MTGVSCPNCGLTIGERMHNLDGVLYCCQGCAERTYCVCRVSAPAITRLPVGGAVKR